MEGDGNVTRISKEQGGIIERNSRARRDDGVILGSEEREEGLSDEIRGPLLCGKRSLEVPIIIHGLAMELLRRMEARHPSGNRGLLSSFFFLLSSPVVCLPSVFFSFFFFFFCCLLLLSFFTVCLSVSVCVIKFSETLTLTLTLP